MQILRVGSNRNLFEIVEMLPEMPQRIIQRQRLISLVEEWKTLFTHIILQKLPVSRN